MIFIDKNSISQMLAYILTGDDTRPGEREVQRSDLPEQRGDEELLDAEIAA